MVQDQGRINKQQRPSDHPIPSIGTEQIFLNASRKTSADEPAGFTSDTPKTNEVSAMIVLHAIRAILDIRGNQTLLPTSTGQILLSRSINRSLPLCQPAPGKEH